MTKKDFFRIIIKIFGLYYVIAIIFSVLPSNFSFVIGQIDLIGILWLIASLFVIIFLFVFLIYKPDKVIHWLRLDKGFDEDRIDFQNFNIQNIIKLALIIIGGIMLIKNISVFLSNTLFAFKSSVGNDINGNVIKYGSLRDYINWGTSFLNIIIGYLVLTNYNSISRILKEKGKEENKTIA
jgi:hypothetical protein